MKAANFRKILLFILVLTVMASLTDTAYAGENVNYDWYEFTFTDENGINITGYISGLGSKFEESIEDIYAIAFKDGDTVWREYLLTDGEWAETGVTYESNPFEAVAGYSEQSELKIQILKYYNEFIKIFYLLILCKF